MAEVRSSQNQRRLLPRLMLPLNGHKYYGDFHNIWGESIHQEDLQKLRNKRCVGSSHGWLIMVDEDTPSISAVNPLDPSCDSVRLPGLLAFPGISGFNGKEYVYHTPSLRPTNVSAKLISNMFVRKVVLSKNPTEEGCIAVVIFGDMKKLAFCRVGDEEWTIVARQYGYEDVVFDHANRFVFAVNFYGVILGFKPTKSIFGEYIFKPKEKSYASRRYLVFDTKGDLLLVNRYIECVEGEEKIEPNEFSYKTSRFEVFKVQVEIERLIKISRLIRIKSLGDGVVFLGDSDSLCLSSAEFPCPGCKKDAIYFTDDNLFAHAEPKIGGHDLGVFNMKDGKIERFSCCPDEDKGIWPPPIWITLPLNRSSIVDSLCCLPCLPTMRTLSFF